KIDSTPISLSNFNRTIEPFRSIQFIADHVAKKYYKESVFHDGSTNSIVFSYATDNADLALQSATIMLDDQSQRVKRIFATKEISNTDSTVFEKLSWKAQERFS